MVCPYCGQPKPCQCPGNPVTYADIRRLRLQMTDTMRATREARASVLDARSSDQIEFALEVLRQEIDREERAW